MKFRKIGLEQSVFPEFKVSANVKVLQMHLK